ncbi:hypothetical protein J4401_03745 [Candidatus Woesearchaeota archaeon]|nr:hypothetical protein [Candidatus Woesearchaeota archaeon]
MKILNIMLALLLVPAISYAALDDFPESFMKGKSFNAYLVVGKDGTSLDVLSQTRIGLALGEYIGSPQIGINKLDSEVTLASNLVLIGNPCVNSLSSELLGNPEPCDKDYPLGKASIKLLSKESRSYIIVAGNSAKGTKVAADYLASNLGKLSGNEKIVTVQDDIALVVQDVKVKESAEKAVKEAEPVIQEKKGEINSNPENQEALANNAGSNVIIVEEKGIFQKFVDWFLGIFGWK